MLATLETYDRAPRVLRLNVSGQPVEWVSWQEAVCLYARELVVWTHGDAILRLRGGHSRFDGSQSNRAAPPLTNKALFGRDRNLCLYCGNTHSDAELTRDHVVPTSRGGTDRWDNVVSACRRCNHRKGSRLTHECSMELLALPYVPNYAEYLALINGGRILGDQMDFLKRSFSRHSRLLQ